MNLNKLRSQNKGSALIVVTLLVLLMMVATISFLKKSTYSLSFSGIKSDVLSAQYQMESAYEVAKNKLDRAIAYNAITGEGIILNTRLQYVGGPSQEDFITLANTYATNQLGFLQALVNQQAYNGSGVKNTAHEFANFNTAFPSTWTDPNVNGSQYFELQYTFTPIDMVTQVSPQVLTFEYEYRLQVRAYGQKKFQSVGSEDAGVISISVQGAPFSQYAAFMDSMKNQNGSTLVFAGGDTSAQDQEVYTGPVHVNQTPNFYGHPTFTDLVTSATAANTWVYYNAPPYTGCPTKCPIFGGGKQGGVASIPMPTQIFNTQRLAAGDTSSTAATNNNAVTNADINGFLANYANGTIAPGSAALPAGIYVPIDSQASKNPTGGIYVQGDAQIQMNVVSGSSDFNATQWSQRAAADQGCKYQKISISSLTAGVHSRDVYVATTPTPGVPVAGTTCNFTYVYDTTTTSQAPVVLNSRIDGNIHVNGKIDQLGGASRTRPAVAQDFGITISAAQDIRIINDIQYEDSKYVTLASDGTQGTSYVANPYGPLNGSGIQPTAEQLAPQVPTDSTTILGIISIGRNVEVHTNAPANINIHAAIYAGDNAAYNASTGIGCGSSGASTQGCGFGYEGWNSKTGMGAIKFLGSLSEFKDQTTGQIGGSTTYGYASYYFYDKRLRSGITPPAFPVSNTPQAIGTMRPYRTWRISKSGP